MITQEEIEKYAQEYEEGVYNNVTILSAYIAGMNKAIELMQEYKKKADKWDALVDTIEEAQKSEENQYPEDYGYILMNHLDIKDNN